MALHTPKQAEQAGAVCTGERCYIGLEREEGGHDWAWTDETRVNYLPWNVSEPGADGGTKVVFLPPAGTGWHDFGMGWTPLPGVCLKTRGLSEPTPLFVVGAGTWDEVRARCRIGGGDLVSLHTPRQAELAGAVCGEPRCYIGLQRATPGEEWMWVDDSEVNYLPWDRAEPASNETKVVLEGAEGRAGPSWHSSGNGSNTFPGVCLSDEGVNDWWSLAEGVELLRPWGAAVAPDGKRAVVSDMGFHKLFVVEVETGERRELAGQRASGSDDGEGTEARFWRPRGVAFAPDGRTVYVADSANHLIRSVSYPEGVVTTLAGKVRLGIGRPGLDDGAMFSGGVGSNGTRVAMFSEPHDVAVSPDGLLVVVAEFQTNRIRVLRLQDGSVVTLAKRWESPLFGIAMGEQFSRPRSIAFGAGGMSLLVANAYGVRVVYLNNYTVDSIVNTDWAAPLDPWYPSGLAPLSDGSLLVAQTTMAERDNTLSVLAGSKLWGLPSWTKAACKGMGFSQEVVMGISQFPGYAAVAVLPGGGGVVLTDPCLSEILIGAYAPAEVAPPSELLDNMVWIAFAQSNGTVWGSSSRRGQLLAAYSAFFSFKCPGISVSACPWSAPDGCLEIEAPSSCVGWAQQWSDLQHEADNVLKVYSLPALPIASVTLGCLAGSSVGSVDYCVPCEEGSYRAGKGSEPCDVCPPHSTSKAGSTSLDDCSCMSGFEGSANTTCAMCEAGAFKSTSGGENSAATNGYYSQLPRDPEP